MKRLRGTFTRVLHRAIELDTLGRSSYTPHWHRPTGRLLQPLGRQVFGRRWYKLRLLRIRLHYHSGGIYSVRYGPLR